MKVCKAHIFELLFISTLSTELFFASIALAFAITVILDIAYCAIISVVFILHRL